MPIPDDIKSKMRFHGVLERSIARLSGAWNHVSATIPGVPMPGWHFDDGLDDDGGDDQPMPSMLWSHDDGDLAYFVTGDDHRDGVWYFDGTGLLARHICQDWERTMVLPAFAHDFLTRLAKNHANDQNCT